jgi:hypothetical protein
VLPFLLPESLRRLILLLLALAALDLVFEGGNGSAERPQERGLCRHHLRSR